MGPAAVSAAALLILTAFFFLPFAGPFMLVLLPAPLAYARMKFGEGLFLAMSASAVGAVSVAGGFPAFTSLVFGFCVTAYVVGGGLRAKERFDSVIFRATLYPSVAAGSVMSLYFAVSGKSPLVQLRGFLEKGAAESVEVYRGMGMSQSDIDAVMPILRGYVSFLADYFPALCVYFISAVGLICFVIVRSHAERAGEIVPAGVPMNRWTAPDQVVWALIVSGFLMVPDVRELRVVAGNLVGLSALAYLYQGAAVVSYFFEKVKLTPFLRFIGYALIFVQLPLLVIVWCVGLADTWADFRKTRPGKKP